MELEVRLRRQVAGCIYWPAVVMTFGLVALIVRVGEQVGLGHFIQRMDETGVSTRGGTRIAWNEFTSIERWQGKMNRPMGSRALSDEYLLESPKGKVSLPLWRIENRQEATDYLFKHLPPSLLS